MLTTSVSLIARLRDPTQHRAWEQFVQLYTPMLWRWTQRIGLQESDAADLVQDVLLTLVRKLPEFELRPEGSFRSWLRTIALNKWRDRTRRASATAAGSAINEAPAPDIASEFELAAYRSQLLHQALRLLEEETQQATWKCFIEHGLKGRSAAEVAAELSMTPGAVYAAKFRVLTRLRSELAGLLDE